MSRQLFHTLRVDPLFRILADRLDRAVWGSIQGAGVQILVDKPSRLIDLVSLFVFLFGVPSHHALTADPHSRLVHLICRYPAFALSIEAVVARSGTAINPEIIISGSIAGSLTLVEYRYGREYLLVEAPKGTSGIMLDIGLTAKEISPLGGGADTSSDDGRSDDSRMDAARELAGIIIGDRLATFDPEPA